MQIGMLGLLGAGKKTLFKLLTGVTVQTVPPKGLPSNFHVRDPRVDRLHEMYNPKKTNYARMDVLLLPDVEKTQGKAAWLGDVRDLDGLICVVRAFDDPSVFHPSGTVDAARDLDTFMSELQFADMLFLDKRVSNLKNELRTRRSVEKENELKLIERLAGEMEAGNAIRSAELSESEARLLSSYQFLTDKPVIAVINAAQGTDAAQLRGEIEQAYPGRVACAVFDVKLEGEIAEIEDAAEKKEFLEGLGIAEPAVAVLTRVIYDSMGLMSYFTVGEDEVRAWTVPQGSNGPRAARAIHSDLERGFIRVEVMKYEDLIGLGGEAQVKEAGKFMLKGKEYIVEEGDILSFRAAT
ncbi:MAG: DUF933 domain-containing protein [Elusimicrobiota bacterium]